MIDACAELEKGVRGCESPSGKFQTYYIQIEKLPKIHVNLLSSR